MKVDTNANVHIYLVSNVIVGFLRIKRVVNDVDFLSRKNKNKLIQSSSNQKLGVFFFFPEINYVVMKIYNLTKFLFSKVYLINYIKRQHKYHIVGVNINYFTHIYFMNMSLFFN